jgi:hypothetical protein
MTPLFDESLIDNSRGIVAQSAVDVIERTNKPAGHAEEETVMDYVIANFGTSLIVAFAVGFVVSLIVCARPE